MRTMLIVAIISVTGVAGCNSEQTSSLAPRADPRTLCIGKKAEIMVAADSLLSQGKPQEAFPLMAECAANLPDDDYQTLLRRVRVAIAKGYVDVTPASQIVARQGALQVWANEAGSLPEPYATELKQLKLKEVENARKREQALAQVAKLDFWDVCLEAGRVLRGTASQREAPRSQVILQGAGMGESDKVLAQERKVEIGMGECAVAASRGRPDYINRTVTSGGRSDQWVYRSGPYRYVYLHDGVVRSYQQ